MPITKDQALRLSDQTEAEELKGVLALIDLKIHQQFPKAKREANHYYKRVIVSLPRDMFVVSLYNIEKEVRSMYEKEGWEVVVNHNPKGIQISLS